MTYPIKQVIVVRKDLNMNKGKMLAQASHASMSFMSRKIGLFSSKDDEEYPIYLKPIEVEWLKGSFAKICLQVSSEEELQDIYDKSLAAGLVVHMIVDSGKTYFKGIPTKTCLAIGPDLSEKIDPITSHLKLI